MRSIRSSAFSQILLFIFIFLSVASAESPQSTTTNQIQINYLDGGIGTECRSKYEKRITGYSGIIFSHQPYGEVYRSDKNCFLMITVPYGYRIRIRALDFHVLGNLTNCNKDTLHIFDHEKNIDDTDNKELEDVSPGPIIGQFCGSLRNGTHLVNSMHNAVTLWWHSDSQLPDRHAGRGFRLHWSAFRNSSNSVACSRKREFRCRNLDCIPISLACDRFADCRDESDIDRNLQREYQCADILEEDIFDSLHGVHLLILCTVVVIGSVVLCVAVCICCRSMRARAPPMMINDKQHTIIQQRTMRQQQQYPPPPAPPPPPPPPTYSPSSRTPAASTSTGGPTLSADYGSRSDMRHYDNISEYAYTRNGVGGDVTRKLLPPRGIL